MSNTKPRRVRAKITRQVTEIATILLDKDGNVEEYGDLIEELDYEDVDIISIHSILSVHP